MAASAGTIKMIGRSGRTYTLDVYIPDAVATMLTLNASGLAASTSPTTWRAPEDVVIKDMSTPGAPTAVGCILQINNANANGGTFRWANQLAANPQRSQLSIPIRAGDFISFLQF